MTTATNQYPKRSKNDGNLIASRMFAQVFEAYLECSDEVQAAIRDMVRVANAPDATNDEREAAIVTIAEALFPSSHNGALGVCLEDCEKEAPKEVREMLRQMDRQEATFGERLTALLEARGVTQAELALAIGVKQPAISMMLSRGCRPQRRTVEKIARELKVAPEELWPGFNDG
jgi:lambda repressor-like predicted transcriptional regulator